MLRRRFLAERSAHGTTHGFAPQISAAYSAYGSVAGKLSGACDVQDGPSRPIVRIGVQLEQPAIRVEIGRKVREVHVVVPAGQQRLAQRLEDARLGATEVIREDQVQNGAGLGLVVVVPVRAVPAAIAGHLLRSETEQEEILLARGLGHFDRGAVAGADRQRSVHHELHIAGPARLVAGRRDLVGYVGGRDQPLGQRDAVLG